MKGMNIINLNFHYMSMKHPNTYTNHKSGLVFKIRVRASIEARSSTYFLKNLFGEASIGIFRGEASIRESAVGIFHHFLAFTESAGSLILIVQQKWNCGLYPLDLVGG